jgi:hypothetical protein
MSLLVALAAIHFVLGAVLGARFRVFMLLPFVALAILEAVVFEPPIVKWSSVLWHSMLLIVCLEIGYLIGAALTTFLSVSGLRSFWHRLRAQLYSKVRPRKPLNLLLVIVPMCFS